MTTRRGSTWLALLGAVVTAVAMRLPILALPLERDEGAYAYMAALWMHGGLPYRDAFDHKPPLLYLLYMPAMLGGAPDALRIRIWASLLFLLQLPIVFFLAHRLWDRWSAALATLLYAVVGSAFTFQGLIFNSEQALVLPALLALWALCKAIESPALMWPAIYGLSLGLVSLIKPTAVPLLLPLILLGQASGSGRRMLHMGVALGAVVLPALLVLVVWAGAGAFQALIFDLVTYNRLYASESLRLWSSAGFVDILASLGPLLVCAIGGAGLAGRGTARRKQRMALVLWTAAMLGAAILGLRPYIHYYYPALPGLALLAAPAVTLIARQSRRPTAWGQRLSATAAPILLVAVLLLPPLIDNVHAAGLSPAQQAEALYGADGTRYFAPATTVAAHIRATTKEGSKIFVWASEPEIYVLANRKAAAYYIYVYPLDLMPAARVDLLRQLRHDPVDLYILYHGSVPQEFRVLIQQQGLRRAGTIAGYDLWAARGAAPR